MNNNSYRSTVSKIILFYSLFYSSFSYAEIHDKNLEILKTAIPLVKGYENKLKNEDLITEELFGIFTKLGDKNRNSEGSLNRATHNKGSCIAGEIRVFSSLELKAMKYPDDLIKNIRGGFFKNAGLYKVQARFANAKGTGENNPDTKADVRGLAISIDTDNKMKDFSNQSRFDLMMNASPMFATDNINGFIRLMHLVTGQYSKILSADVLKAIALLKIYEVNNAKSYATENYWSNIPYVHGLKADGSPAQIAKYKLTPCDGRGRQTESSNGKSDDYLQTDIKARADQGQICFDLQAQFFDKEKLKNFLFSNSANSNRKFKDENAASVKPFSLANIAYLTAQNNDQFTAASLVANSDLASKLNSNEFWIENGGALWPTKILPFYTIARFQISKNTIVQSQNECNERYFNTRLHAAAENMPIGSLSRVRAYVEELSRARRAGEIN